MPEDGKTHGPVSDLPKNSSTKSAAQAFAEIQDRAISPNGVADASMVSGTPVRLDAQKPAIPFQRNRAQQKVL